MIKTVHCFQHLLSVLKLFSIIVDRANFPQYPLSTCSFKWNHFLHDKVLAWPFGQVHTNGTISSWKDTCNFHTIFLKAHCLSFLYFSTTKSRCCSFFVRETGLALWGWAKCCGEQQGNHLEGTLRQPYRKNQ